METWKAENELITRVCSLSTFLSLNFDVKGNQFKMWLFVCAFVCSIKAYKLGESVL